VDRLVNRAVDQVGPLDVRMTVTAGFELERWFTTEVYEVTVPVTCTIAANGR
jgi:hypothetical protein